MGLIPFVAAVLASMHPESLFCCARSSLSLFTFPAARLNPLWRTVCSAHYVARVAPTPKSPSVMCPMRACVCVSIYIPSLSLYNTTWPRIPFFSEANLALSMVLLSNERFQGLIVGRTWVILLVIASKRLKVLNKFAFIERLGLLLIKVLVVRKVYIWFYN